VPDQILENSEHMPAIFNDAFKHRPKVRLALTLAVPLGQNRRRNGNVPPQLLRIVAAQEKAVKKCSFTLRELKILHDFVERIGLRCHSRKGQFTDFGVAVKSP